MTVPGLGRKTAQRLILELAGTLTSDHTGAGAPPPATDDDPRAEVRIALASLGYEPSEITRALQTVGDGVAQDAETLLRRALQVLAAAR